ncbi:hypothetical protein F5B19DRAFT_88909 [Rostrohypoxylon terebratum]|nr:hypothetical protein F5B19DRAFT_88909 [Rostrohypoxylon terebratum]
MSSSGPQKPTSEEQSNYYYGFAGQPRLIARTSCDQWVKPTRTEETWSGLIRVPVRKEYATIGSDIASKWSLELVDRLINRLRKCSWSFFPIRIGLEGRRRQKEFPGILLIAVEDDTLSWEDGIQVALECREALRMHSVDNVEVEIREGRCHNLAASVELEGLVERDRGFGSDLNNILLPLLSFPGYPVAYAEARPGQGTMGLHIKLHGDESIYGLTCRHVVCRDRTAEERYEFSVESKPEYHAQANDDTFGCCRYEIDQQIEDAEQTAGQISKRMRLWDEWYSLDETKTHLQPTESDHKQLAFLVDYINYGKKFVGPLARIEDKNARKIGQLMFHSSMELSTHQKGYLKDWALIKLDLDKFSERPSNRVLVVDGPKGGMAKHEYMLFQAWLRESTRDNHGFVPLRQSYVDLKSRMGVCKRGATTGLTFGMKNEVEAVVRRPGCAQGKLLAWQMVIIPFQGRFSAKGDSGSCVLDDQGRIVGLLTSSDNKGDWLPDGRRRHPGENCPPEGVAKDEASSSEIPDGMDITLADPMQWVFDDIERFTSRKVELA